MRVLYFVEMHHYLWFTHYQIHLSPAGKEVFTLSTWSTRKYGEMVRVLQLLACKAGN